MKISTFSLVAAAVMTAAPSNSDLLTARDHQDLAALDRDIAALESQAKSAQDEYRVALACSYAAEVAMELHDKRKSAGYAEKGYEAAQRAVEANQGNAEYHRIMGALCGQVIPANPLMGTLKYGPCARDEINKAIELNGNLALAYVSRGVGNYYLPESLGGGIGPALKDFDKAISLDPKLADAYLWKGVALRKANRPADARLALEQALRLDPNRVWAQQEMAKLPAQ